MATSRALRFSAEAKIVRIDIEPQEIAVSPRRLNLGIVADLRTALTHLSAALGGRVSAHGFAPWRNRLRSRDEAKVSDQERVFSNESMPIHPLRLGRDLRDVLDRKSILCVDGQEILDYARQVIATFTAWHRMNSGTFGTMGGGLPLGFGAKAACPDAPVAVLHAGGSFGMNPMESGTLVRHKLPVLEVISLNGGWTDDPDRERPGHDLGYTRYDLMAEALGGCGGFARGGAKKPEIDEKPEIDDEQVKELHVKLGELAVAP